MKTEKYIPTEFTCTDYVYVTKQDVSNYHTELSFVGNNNKMKYPKDSKNGYGCYKKTRTEVFQNTPTGNFKINSNHYMHLDYFSIVDGVMIEDIRGFVFKISNANFIQLARECVIRNGTIEDECVIGFDKNARATLVKVGSSFHKEVLSYTEKQNYEFKEEDLVVGKTYRFKKDQNSYYVYLGKHKFKSKCDTYRFDASVSQPKVPQHIFAFVFQDGSISTRFTSSKVSSIQDEVHIDGGLKTKLENILTYFKNNWQGRVITKVEISPMSKTERESQKNNSNEKYVVLLYKDGSKHLAKNSGSCFNYRNDYICPIDPVTNMPLMTDWMKSGRMVSREDDGRANSPDNVWYNVTFKFEDPLSINF